MLARVSVTSVPFFKVTVALVPSDVIFVTSLANVCAAAFSILKLVSSLDTTFTVPMVISAPSVSFAAVVPFAFTVTPSTVPNTSSCAKVFVLPFYAASPFKR